MSAPVKWTNNVMAKMLDSGEAIDVTMVGDPVPGFEGVWVMEDFLDDMDYCDGLNGFWIFSIGKHKIDGRYYAAIDNRFYQNPMFECVWLR